MATTPRQDIKIDDNNDVVFLNGDFTITFSDEQHVIDTLNAYPGFWKQYPTDGVGLEQYLGSPSSDQVLIRQIKLQLDSDGYSTSQTKIVRDYSDKITIYPNATLK